MEEAYTFAQFREIVARLRSEQGCPWDRAQTHESLKSCLINEAVEVVAAINIHSKTGQSTNLCEELGDLLMQVVIQSRIAEEQGDFTLDDVVAGISRKMINRHPHVFGTGYRDEQGELIRNWDEIKKKEKEGLPEEALKNQKMEERLAVAETITFLRKE